MLRKLQGRFQITDKILSQRSRFNIHKIFTAARKPIFWFLTEDVHILHNDSYGL